VTNDPPSGTYILTGLIINEVFHDIGKVIEMCGGNISKSKGSGQTRRDQDMPIQKAISGAGATLIQQARARREFLREELRLLKLLDTIESRLL
jgi:hypothetical protein